MPNSWKNRTCRILCSSTHNAPIVVGDFVFCAEAAGFFDVRECILGHLQRGGAPTAFDRIQGVRLGARAARQILDDIAAGRDHVNVIGLEQRGIRVTPYDEAMAKMDLENDRPKEQSFLRWRGLADKLAKPEPGPVASR